MRPLSAFAFILILAGCTQTSGRPINQADVQSFKVGQTTETDVEAKLGVPKSTQTMSDGTTQVTYSYVVTTTRAATFIPIAGLFAGGADSKYQVVVFVFDQNHLLTFINQGSGATDASQGS